MASHGPAECEEPHLGRAAGIDGDDDVESQHLLQRGSNDRKQQRRRFFRVNSLPLITLANKKDNGRNGKGGVYFNAKPTKGNQRSRTYTSAGEGMHYHVQKNLRRNLHKHTKPGHGTIGHKYRLAAYCVGKSIILDLVFKAIKSRRLKTGERWKTNVYNDVIHCHLEATSTPCNTTSEPSDDPQYEIIDMGEYDEIGPSTQLISHNFNDCGYTEEKYESSCDIPTSKFPLPFRRDAFIFSYGCVVFWGFTKAGEHDFMTVLEYGVSEAVTDEELQESFDAMTFTYVGKQSDAEICGDNIPLITKTAMEKLSYSFSLAQSSKLFVYQTRVVESTESARQYPFTLMKTGRISFSATQVNKLIGKILVLRNEVNLHSDILDTPEFFWDEDQWEVAYHNLCNYLDIEPRVNILNQRMGILKELLELLNTCVTDTHATKLEKIIIYLILLECCVDIIWNVFVKDILGLYNNCSYHSLDY